MSEVVFPLLGPVLVVVAVLPIGAVIAHMVLAAALRSDREPRLLGLSFVAILGSVMLPIAWLASAALHQAEASGSVLACLFAHHDGTCVEPGLFSATLLGSMGILALPPVLAARRRRRPRRHASSSRADARIARVVEGAPGLAALRGRVFVDDELEVAIATEGLVRPVVVARTDYLDCLDDLALAAALAHELEHVKSFDPLRYLALSVAVALNPFGHRWIRSDVRRWVRAREARCDRDAVVGGASAAALAHALVVAARPDAPNPTSVALADAALEALDVRVRMLLEYAERPPTAVAPGRLPALPLAAALLGIVIALPHLGQTAPLDVLHRGAESPVAVWFR